MGEPAEIPAGFNRPAVDCQTLAGAPPKVLEALCANKKKRLQKFCEVFSEKLPGAGPGIGTAKPRNANIATYFKGVRIL